MTKSVFYVLVLLLLTACAEDKPEHLFTKLSKNKTGIDFRNMLNENETFNIFKYQYFNNGGGLAVGDFNNDDLQDILFTGNMVKNRLYLNEGDFSFKDVTKQSGIAKHEGWCTGATTVDINQDGWLDVYVCRAAFPFKKLRKNLLFVNNGASGKVSFTEKAAEYGLDDAAFSTHSAFFDYDKDGDLDLFVLNHSTVEYSRGALEVFQLRNKRTPEYTNKLYRNDKGKFVNVTETAGVTSNVLSFSLGISISDINNDNWPDVLIGNDFNEPDYLFINQKDGTFSDEFATTFDHTSMFSMGSDIADFNNDGLLDVVSLDMLSESNYRQKMHSGADNYKKVALLEKSGFLPQYSRNMLQLNNGDGSFSEISQMAGVSNTDWSWAPLFFDFDNDGRKDLFIANGYPKDHTDMDFLNFTANEVVKIDKGEAHVDFDGYMAAMPAILVPNYFYKNNGTLGFENKTKEWGLDEAMVSQSAAYADLDNDGDLDLILNNTNDYAAVYRNNTNTLLQNNFLRIKLNGKSGNPTGIGAKVHLKSGESTFFQEQFPVRGFQATVDPVLNFGLGKVSQLDELKVQWPGGETQIIKNVEVNQTLELSIENAQAEKPSEVAAVSSWLKPKNITNIKHQENEYSDFDDQFLIPWFFSRKGPALAVADVNGDGKEDLFMGNAKGNASQLLLQKNAKSLEQSNSKVFEENKNAEDVDAVFLDVNGDGHQDLYVACGSYEFAQKSFLLQDRLYINNGNGQMKLAPKNLPDFKINSTCVRYADVDKDGDLDLFVGGGYINKRYPECFSSQLLINDGKGVFKNIRVELPVHGAVNDAAWLDLNGDGWEDLIVVGEWMSIKVFENNKGKLIDQSEKYFEQTQAGLWNSLHAADLDNDGDLDLALGNLGLNSQLSASPTAPLELFTGDFDNNGSPDPLLCYYVLGESWPFVSREDLIGQLPVMKKKFLYFKDYANAKIDNILSPEQLKNAKKLAVTTLENSYFENQNGKFVKKELPLKIQNAPVNSILSLDANKDGHLDLLMAGNKAHTRVKLGRLDGNHGLLLLGDGKGNFSLASQSESGLDVREVVESLDQINIGGTKHIVVGVNDGEVLFYN